MSSLVPVRRALVSVSDKTDLVPFARALVEMGVEIVSTGGTARILAAAEVPVIGVDRVTGFPEMMDGRVKTLHPAIHGVLLARRDQAAHRQAMADHGITPIDLVCINLYPFERTILEPGTSEDEAIEQIDIGGPAALRSAAKNHESVTVVTAAAQYDRVVNELRANDGATTLALRRELAAAAYARTAEYDTTISAWMSARREEPFPTLLRITCAHVSDLRYGENPHQRAAAYADPAFPGPSVVSAPLLHGKPLSYNNINDAAAALDLVGDLRQTFPGRAAAAIVKHTNPCGAAVAAGGAEAFDLAYEGDPLAAYGGILALSRPVDAETAGRICAGRKFLEVIVAPGYEDEARAALAERWKSVRLLQVPEGEDRGGGLAFRSVPGGMLVQERDRTLANPRQWVHAAGPPPSEALLAEAALPWTVVKHLTSNAVAIAAGGALLGAGAGQMDRVQACRLAIDKSGPRVGAGGTAGAVIAASDAFFPFPDGPDLLVSAGVNCLVHPGGSMRDQETLDLCSARDVTCLLTGTRHFRH